MPIPLFSGTDNDLSLFFLFYCKGDRFLICPFAGRPLSKAAQKGLNARRPKSGVARRRHSESAFFDQIAVSGPRPRKKPAGKARKPRGARRTLSVRRSDEGRRATPHHALHTPIDLESPSKAVQKGLNARRPKCWDARRTFSYVERRRMRATQQAAPFQRPGPATRSR